MKILITSGGTTESIDTVRGITNFATGRLGKMTAETFLEAGHQVFLLAGAHAHLPEPAENLTVISISDTQDLYAQMKRLVPEVDAVVHSMAVSDYRPVYMTAVDQLPSPLTPASLLNFRPEQEKKISSQAQHQIMLLEKTPKILDEIKKWNSSVLLFGFKLLSGAEDSELIRIAREKLASTGADFIVANDLQGITGQQHRALLISPNQGNIEMMTKSEIAQTILEKTEGYFHG